MLKTSTRYSKTLRLLKLAWLWSWLQSLIITVFQMQKRFSCWPQVNLFQTFNCRIVKKIAEEMHIGDDGSKMYLSNKLQPVNLMYMAISYYDVFSSSG